MIRWGHEIYHIAISNNRQPYQLKKYTNANYLKGTYEARYLHGAHQVLYDDNNINSGFNYKYGVLDSTVKAYYYGGIVQYEGQYKMGEKNGKWNYYYDNGKLYYTEAYDNGRLNGVTKLFNDDGMLDKEISYVEGEVDGEYKMFADEGQLAMIINYQQDKITSYTYMDKQGKLIPPIPVVNGNANSDSLFSKTGLKALSFPLKMVTFMAPRKLYFSTGKIYVDGTRYYGFDHGVKKVYLPDGSLHKEQNYHYDKLHGQVKSYYPSGKIVGRRKLVQW